MASRDELAPRPLTEEELVQHCWEYFYITAGIQGRIAYLLMSVHAVNPSLFKWAHNYSPTQILFSNMIYGMIVHIFARPSMQKINFQNRITFSVLGSMMFNYSSMLVFNWLKERFSHRPILLTFLGFMSGRLMLVNFFAYLYHTDRSTNRAQTRINSVYETMYL